MVDPGIRNKISNCSVAILIALSQNWHETIRVREIDMANNSSQSNGDMSFSVNINDYGDADVMTFGTSIRKVSNLREVVNDVEKTALSHCLQSEFSSKLNVSTQSWVDLGLDCKVLSVGRKGWRNGKVKFEITVKFYPDEPEPEELSQAQSSFDDIRQMVNKLS